MFGIFKKKLKDVVSKISKKISGGKAEEQVKEEKAQESQIAEKSEEMREEKVDNGASVSQKPVAELPSEEKASEEATSNAEQEQLKELTEEPSISGSEENETGEEIVHEEHIVAEIPEEKMVQEEEHKESESAPEREEQTDSTKTGSEDSIKSVKEGSDKSVEESTNAGVLEESTEKEEKSLEKSPNREENVSAEIVPTKESDKLKEEHEKEAPKEKNKVGFFKRFVKKITEKKITEDDFNSIVDDLKITLLQNDVAFEVVEKIINDMKAELIGKSVRRGNVSNEIISALRRSLLNVLDQKWIDIEEIINKKDEPALIVFVGFNGVGKTTTLAKLGYMLKSRGHKIVFAAGDTFRAASIEQLEYHAKKLDVPLIKHDYGSDSAAVIFDAVKHAKAKGYDVVLADTAGRSHANVNLMDELKKVVRVNNPNFKILVVDSLTGNDAVEQAKRFDETVGIDGIVLTKFDVNDRGGAALSVGYITKKPILYIGTGQEYEDIKKFEPDEIVKELLGE